MSEGPLPAALSLPAMRTRLRLLVESHRCFTGRDLIAESDDPVAALWQSPLVIVAHGTQPDPIFFFGNHAALLRFETSFEAFTQMPSRLSAEPLHRAAREALMARVSSDGCIQDYSGTRISATQRRFRIEAATVWNLTDAGGMIHGQAAAFDRWVDLE